MRNGFLDEKKIFCQSWNSFIFFSHERYLCVCFCLCCPRRSEMDGAQLENGDVRCLCAPVSQSLAIFESQYMTIVVGLFAHVASHCQYSKSWTNHRSRLAERGGNLD